MKFFRELALIGIVFLTISFAYIISTNIKIAKNGMKIERVSE